MAATHLRILRTLDEVLQYMTGGKFSLLDDLSLMSRRCYHTAGEDRKENDDGYYELDPGNGCG